MRYTIIFSLIMLSYTLSFSQTEESPLRNFFSPFHLPDTLSEQTAVDSSPATKWALRPTVVLPAFKVLESSREDAPIDVFVLTSVGGGISYQNLKYDKKSKKWKSTFSWSPLTVLLAGNLNDKNASLDLSLATTVGVLNNLLMIGCGYDLGSVKDRSRFFGLFSIGINFNN